LLLNRFGLGADDLLSPRSSGRSSAWVLLLLGLSVLTLAMARPQAPIDVPRIEGTVILAFDVSGSMAADDLKPTRMEAAKAAAREFVEAQPAGVRLGVVAFSDSGFATVPPSYDREEILAAIQRLSPQRGTSLANGILVSLNTIETQDGAETQFYSALTPVPTLEPTPYAPGEYSSASIVLLSDGENTERPDPVEAALEAAHRGVRLYTVGIGSPSGANITVEGITIRSRLDEQALKQLAEITGGQYFAAPAEDELKGVFRELKPEFVVREEQTELTAILAALGTMLLLAGAAMSVLRTGRVA
jgi:Ca-activated chloride channel family protein